MASSFPISEDLALTQPQMHLLTNLHPLLFYFMIFSFKISHVLEKYLQLEENSGINALSNSQCISYTSKLEIKCDVLGLCRKSTKYSHTMVIILSENS